MSNDIPVVEPAGDAAHPVRRIYVTEQPSAFRSVLNWLARLLFAGSILLNLFFLFMIAASSGGGRLSEHHYAGDRDAKAKIAIVRIDGVMLEGFLGFAEMQLRNAAGDPQVKAVVLAVNSPGGSVTASDQLYKLVTDLREGKLASQGGMSMPVVVAMESVAASGGYYIAAAADYIFAQPTTITGSIGVYAPFFDLRGVPEKWGVDMRVLKKGDLKGSTLFRALEPEEVRHWDDLLEHTYQRFIKIVKDGRGDKLKHGLLDPIPDPKNEKLPNGAPFVRRLADGGVFNADEAKEFGLIDEVGYLDAAIEHAKSLAGATYVNVIAYERPVSLRESLLGIQTSPPERGMGLLDLPGATRRMWYLTPGFEMAGVRLPARLFE